jgi:hypothetical protein
MLSCFNLIGLNENHVVQRSMVTTEFVGIKFAVKKSVEY